MEKVETENLSTFEKVVGWLYVNFKVLIYPILIFVFFIFLYIAPNRHMYIYFTIIFLYVLKKSFSLLLDIVNVLVVDFENSRIGMWILSSKAYNRYDKIDEMGKDSSAKWKLTGMAGEVVVANDIDTVGKRIIINQICSNLHFVRDFKDRVVKLSEYTTRQLHAIIRLKNDREFETLKNGYDIYDKNKVLSLLEDDVDVYESKEEKVEEEKVEEEVEVE